MAFELTTTASILEQLRSRIELRTATVAVIGLGYVGLPLAETFAAGGFTVVGFDIDPEKVKKLKTGQSYIRHIPPERVGELLKSGRFRATCEPTCFADTDVSVICVPTPLTEAREPDLTYVVKSAEASAVDLYISTENSMLTFRVEDDGKGFDPGTVTQGSGLQNMRDRLEALGGSLDVRSAPGRGTTVVGKVKLSV